MRCGPILRSLVYTSLLVPAVRFSKGIEPTSGRWPCGTKTRIRRFVLVPQIDHLWAATCARSLTHFEAPDACFISPQSVISIRFEVRPLREP